MPTHSREKKCTVPRHSARMMIPQYGATPTASIANLLLQASAVGKTNPLHQLLRFQSQRHTSLQTQSLRVRALHRLRRFRLRLKLQSQLRQLRFHSPIPDRPRLQLRPRRPAHSRRQSQRTTRHRPRQRDRGPLRPRLQFRPWRPAHPRRRAQRIMLRHHNLAPSHMKWYRLRHHERNPLRPRLQFRPHQSVQSQGCSKTITLLSKTDVI